MKQATLQEICAKAKVGTVAGLVGGFALFVSFFGIDSQLSTQPGTFYMMVGLAVGLHGTAAILFGFISHMLTAVSIGVVFCVVSTLHPRLNLTSTWKGTFAGGITGLQVYVIFFLPITIFIIFPTIDSIASKQTSSTVQELATVSLLKSHITMIMYGALVLHLLFGSIMGLFSGMVLRDEYKKKHYLEMESESMPAT